MERKPTVGDAPPTTKQSDSPQTAAALHAADHPSKGYGFVEFKHHAHALAALRELNNNPNCSHVAKGFNLEKASRKCIFKYFVCILPMYMSMKCISVHTA
jgi:RNA recognition motif. (a.k.a. RRM, RBD, or RNP domain)